MAKTQNNELRKQALFDETVALMKATGLLPDDVSDAPFKHAIIRDNKSRRRYLFKLKNSSIVFVETNLHLISYLHPLFMSIQPIVRFFDERRDQTINVDTLTLADNKDIEKNIKYIKKQIDRLYSQGLTNDARESALENLNNELKRLQEQNAAENSAAMFNKTIREFIDSCNHHLDGICIYNQIIHYLNHTRTLNKENHADDYLISLPIVLNRVKNTKKIDLKNADARTQFEADIKTLAKIARSASLKKHGHRALGVLLMTFVGIIAQCIPSLKKYIHLQFEKANTLGALSDSIRLFKTNNECNKRPKEIKRPQRMNV